MIIDLSHPIRRGGFVYPGLPAPEIAPFRSHEQKGRPYGPDTSFAMTRVNAVTNIGTYLDSPYHRHERGPDFTGVPLEDPERPAHTLLLGAGILVCEHLTGRERLAVRVFRFFAAPPAWEGVASFPVRAFGVVE